MTESDKIRDFLKMARDMIANPNVTSYLPGGDLDDACGYLEGLLELVDALDPSGSAREVLERQS